MAERSEALASEAREACRALGRRTAGSGGAAPGGAQGGAPGPWPGGGARGGAPGKF